jgi:hypothetical protein
MVRVVTAPAAAPAATAPVVQDWTTRFARFTRLVRYVRWWTVLALAFLTMAGRASGFSATCTAPPPMIAPPQVQAQSFARAIFTDMIRTLFWCWRRIMWISPNNRSPALAIPDRCQRSGGAQVR